MNNKININDSLVMTNRIGIIIPMMIAIGTILMTTLAILPNMTENAHASPCSHNTAGIGGHGGNGGYGGHGGNGGSVSCSLKEDLDIQINQNVG